jgi:flagellar hook assembly protein FlgD
LAPAEVSVFDVSGRLVRTVARGVYGAGYQTAVWDGRDGAGRTVSTGIYFIRAESAGQVKTLKLAVVR